MRVAILGYGNLGKGVEKAVKQNNAQTHTNNIFFIIDFP